jgi:hypothetical protein
MGLDQYAYVAMHPGQHDEFWAGAEVDPATRQYVNARVPEPRELAYWRKHPNLQGWMEQLWRERGCPGAQDDDSVFNGVELELDWEAIERLELDILSGRLPTTQGFFFGADSDEHYQEQDLEFCRLARAELFMKLRVFYNSSW